MVLCKGFHCFEKGRAVCGTAAFAVNQYFITPGAAGKHS
jgi:hypothetical protein